MATAKARSAAVKKTATKKKAVAKKEAVAKKKTVAKKSPAGRRRLKIATFNVNGVRGRLPVLLQWLQKAEPDVVCLQELKSVDFPLAEVQKLGYTSIWNGQRGWNGVALLAKDSPIPETRRALPGAEADEPARYLEAAAFGVVFAGIYLPNGNPIKSPKFDYKLAWFERLIAHAQALWDSRHPVVILGDFNVVPTDFDIYDPKSWLKDALLQPESRECYERLLAQGWTDVIRARFPQQRVYTFWDYFRKHWERNAGLRIDHLLLSRDLAQRVVDAGVDTWVRGLPKASDHAPTWAVLEL